MPTGCSCGKIPCIILPGIGQSKTAEYNPDGSIKRIVWPYDDFNSKRIVKRILPNAAAAIITRHDVGLPKRLADAVVTELDGLLNRPDGSPKNNIRAVTYPGSLAECSDEQRRYIYRMVPVPTLENSLGADHIWFFAYNSFGQTFEIVEALREYIQLVKKRTGHDKVNLVPISLGGTIATAYLGKYGSDGDVNRVVSIVPAFNGTKAIADALDDNIDYDNWLDVMYTVFGKKTAQEMQKYLGLFSKKTGLNVIRAVIRAVVKAVFMNSVTMWGAVPFDEYEALSRKHIGDESHKALLAQADEAYTYRRGFEQTVKQLQAQGVVFDDICCHGLQLFEFCKTNTLDSDHVVHTASASMGATIAPLGQTLPDGYTPAACPCGRSHISPCNTVDAAAGLAPDTTWYFKGQAHDYVQDCRPVLELAEWLLADETPKDVFTDERYKQFTVIK